MGVDSHSIAAGFNNLGNFAAQGCTAVREVFRGKPAKQRKFYYSNLAWQAGFDKRRPQPFPEQLLLPELAIGNFQMGTPADFGRQVDDEFLPHYYSVFTYLPVL